MTSAHLGLDDEKLLRGMSLSSFCECMGIDMQGELFKFNVILDTLLLLDK